MAERPELAQRRADVSAAVATLGEAMGQLQRLPRELAGDEGGGGERGSADGSRLALPPPGRWSGSGGGGGDREPAAEAQRATAGWSPNQAQRGRPYGASSRRGGGGAAAQREAARTAVRGLEMYQGLNVSTAGLRSGSARAVRAQSAGRGTEREHGDFAPALDEIGNGRDSLFLSLSPRGR
jgi:hypothetical protein